MEVGDLAPALLALCDLVEEANEAATGGETRVKLTVRAGFRRGSFAIDLRILQEMWKEAATLFSGPHATAVANILAIIGIPGGIGLIQLIRRSRGKAAKSAIQITETRTVRVEFEGEPPVDVDQRVWRLFQNPKAREAASRLVKPLARPGVDSVRFVAGGSETTVADSDSVSSFELPVEHEGEVSREDRRVLQIVAMSFKDGNKWRVSDGGRTLYVSVVDEDFLAKVKRRDVLFGNNDYLDASLRTRQWIEDGQLRVSYEILKIHRHSASAEQLLFGFEK